ncbi:MAG: ComEC/Rec2 family competence protein [Bacteroidia bacterium]
MKYFYWNKVPLVRLLLPFSAGIVSAVFIGINIPLTVTAAIFFLLVISLLHFTGYIKNNYSQRWIFGVFITLFFVCAGNLLTSLHIETNDENHFSHYTKKENQYIGYLDEALNEREKSFKSVIRVQSVIEEGKQIPVKGNLLVYFAKDSINKKLNYGEVIIFRASPTDITPPQNPYEFNYKRFLSFNNIYQQAYLKSEDITATGRNSGNKFVFHAQQTQQSLLNVFKENEITGDEYAVLSALMLGHKDELDSQLKQAYSSSGAMHVLAVSGLHVGIIFLAISKLLFFLDKKRWQILLKGVIIILFLWCYAFITGLSPSVMRSVTMLSFVIAAGMLARESNIYNTLAASAFVLLLIDPFLIMAVGFQLSYLAVVGIVAIQPKIYDLYYPKNWLIRQAWAIVCVSIAAQLATFPLGMLYFHQFPNYFLLSNLLVIPLATFILYGGIALFVFSAIPIIAGFMSLIVKNLVLFLNKSVFFMEQLPHSLSQGISHTVLDTWIIYLVIASLFFAVLMKCKKQLTVSLSLLLIFSISTAAKKAEGLNRQKLVVFNVNGSKAYNFISGKEHIFLADSALVADEDKMVFHIRKYWDNEGMNKPTIIYTNAIPDRFYHEDTQFFIKNNCILFGSKKIILKTDDPGVNYNDKVKVDMLIYAGRNDKALTEIKENYEFDTLILDSSRPDYLQKRIKEKIAENGINYYCVKEKGYFIMNL